MSKGRSLHQRVNEPGETLSWRFELHLSRHHERWLREQSHIRHQSMAGIVASAIDMLMAVTPPAVKRVKDIR